MKLSRRGFIEAVTLPRALPGAYDFGVRPYLHRLIDLAELEFLPPQREVSVMKHAAVGITTGVLENAIGYFLDHPEDIPSPPLPKWVTEDTKAQLRSAVSYLEQYRLKRELERLAVLLRQPTGRPDLVVIDGIGYGKDDPLPPPFWEGLMGVYYQAVCRERREQLEPFNLDGGKLGTVVRGRFAHLLAFVMAGRWLGEKVQMAAEVTSEDVSDEKGEFADVTLEELEKYEREYPAEEET